MKLPLVKTQTWTGLLYLFKMHRAITFGFSPKIELELFM